jgi:hypothetical protein
MNERRLVWKMDLEVNLYALQQTLSLRKPIAQRLRLDAIRDFSLLTSKGYYLFKIAS